MAAAVVFQCTACRALGSAVDVVVAGDGRKAGLVCPLCRFTSWLPVSGGAHFDAHVDVDVDGAATVTVDPPTGLPPPHKAPTVAPPPSQVTPASSTALVPAATTLPAPSSGALTGLGGLRDAARVRERIEKALPAPSPEQTDLAQRFDRLLTATWDNTAEHKTLLKGAAMKGELAFLGARYRAVLDVVKEEPQARAAQQELLTMAMATMQQSKDLGSVADEKKGPGVAAAIAVLLVVLVGGGFFVRMMINNVEQKLETPSP